MEKISEKKPISRKKIAVIIIVLIVGIIFISVGMYMYNYGWENYLLALASQGRIIEYIGWGISIFSIIACIAVVILYFSKRKE
ncbi:MAG: hypothetical protein ACFFAA_10100 [Promethearchaeota archaeon]